MRGIRRSRSGLCAPMRGTRPNRRAPTRPFMDDEITGQSRARRRQRLTTREAVTSWSMVVLFLAVSLPLAAFGLSSVSWLALVLLVVAYAAVSRVEFEAG